MKLEDFLKQGIQYSKEHWPNRSRSRFLRFLKALPHIAKGIIKNIFGPDIKFKDRIAGIFVTTLLLLIVGFVTQIVYFFSSSIYRTLKVLYFNPDELSNLDHAIAQNLLVFEIVLLSLFLLYIFYPRKRRRAKLKVERDIDQSRGYEFPFSIEDYKVAAEVLRKIKPIDYDKAMEKYSSKIVHLLYLAGGIAFVGDNKLRRLVSIKSIEEDREAGLEDE